MKTDSDLRHDVERELEWDPSIDERRIGVAVMDGVVTLTGEVSSFSEKWRAERAVERVDGVRGIVNELEVKLLAERSDVDIAKSATEALKWNVMVPSDAVKVKVDHGWLTLTVDTPVARSESSRSPRTTFSPRVSTTLPCSISLRVVRS